MTDNIKNISNLAKDKGFTPKTFTTKWTFNSYFSRKNLLITETCEFLLLSEIQKWLRDTHDLDILPEKCLKGYYYYLRYKFGTENNSSKCQEGYCETYEKAIEMGILEGLKQI